MGDERQRLAGTARAACPSDAVDVILGIDGNVVVDNMGDVRDINAARGDIGGDQDVEPLASELGQNALALVLRDVAVDAAGAQAGLRQCLFQTIRAVAGAGENQCAAAAFAGLVQQGQEQVALLSGGHAVNDLLDLGDDGRARAGIDDGRVAEISARQHFDIAVHRGREQHGLARWASQMLGDPLHLGQEAHV